MDLSLEAFFNQQISGLVQSMVNGGAYLAILGAKDPKGSPLLL